jgi:AcrR family transcriptional regulator
VTTGAHAGDDAPTRQALAKRRRRDALEQAALALFAEQGYKDTTATQIAERANVSRRTFFYHFTSKDDILFAIDEERVSSLTSAVRAQPAALCDLHAAEAALQAWVTTGSHSGQNVRRVLLLRQAAAQSTVLRGKELDIHRAYAAAIAQGLAERRGLAEPDRSAITVGAVAQTLMRLVADRWVAHMADAPDGGEPPRWPPLIAEQFAAARAMAACDADRCTPRPPGPARQAAGQHPRRRSS